MICQHNVRSFKHKIPLRYDYLEKCLKELSKYIEENNSPSNVSIIMPKIGSGLSGGDWSKIEKIIESALNNFEINVYIL